MMATATPNMLQTGSIQNIKFSSTDVSEYGTEISAQTVNIQCDVRGHTLGSSKVQLTDRVSYNWEVRYYDGNLITAHIGSNIVAFTLREKEGVSKIRVANQTNPEKKTLIKNIKGDVHDIAFAYTRPEIVLGFVDSEGNILIHQVLETKDSIICTLLCHIRHTDIVSKNVNYRLIWCPFVPNYEDDDSDIGDEPDKMFAVLSNKRVGIYNVGVLLKSYNKTEFPITPNENYEGYIEINHVDSITNASFALDGTAIAIASKDGYVKFFQLYMLDKPKQKCLHEWKPHNGKPLSSILFVDNVLEFSPECWKFTITAAKDNSEIKLWSCESWNCLQTLVFHKHPDSKISEFCFDIAIDYTGQFLVMSDIYNCGVYVLQLKRNDSVNQIAVTNLYYFQLPAPFLSFQITAAHIKTIPYFYENIDSEDVYDNDPEYLDDSTELGQIQVLNLKLLVIQPKRFQECCIRFHIEDLLSKSQPITESCIAPSINDNSEKEDSLRKVPALDDLHNSVNLLIQQQQLETSNPKLTLMTPDDFTSGKNSKSSSIRNSMTNENITEESVEISNESKVNEFKKSQKDNFASGGSSPSREVQEILSLNNSSTGYPTQEYFNNLASLEVEDEQEHPQKDYSAPSENALLYQEPLNWAKIPIVKNSDVIKKMTDTTELNNQDLETVYIRINTLENMMRAQNTIMQQLHQDIKGLNQKVGCCTKNVDKTDLVKELDMAMSKQHLQIAQMLENLVQLQKTKDREMQESLLTSVAQMVNKSFTDKIQHTLQHEIKQSILPVLHQMVDTYRHQIDSHYTHKFVNIDAVIKENFAKVINSKSLTDSITVSVVNNITPTLEKCYREIIGKTLIPSWERVCSQMFQQINDSFTKGTKEYIASVESYMERQRKVQDRGKELITQMQTVSENMKGNADKLSDIVSTEIHKQFSVVFKNIQDKLGHNLKEALSSEIRQGFKNQATVLEEGVINAVRSRAVTPAPHADSHLLTLPNIQQALAKRNYDEAFQLALSAENLNYVIFVCERVDVNQVFSERCILSQSVLLALIQQLSMELHKNTEIKLCFIRAAFLALLPDGPQTKHFVPNVLRDLIRQLTLFMQTNPPLKQMTDARLLKMAVENMLK